MRPSPPYPGTAQDGCRLRSGRRIKDLRPAPPLGRICPVYGYQGVKRYRRHRCSARCGRRVAVGVEGRARWRDSLSFFTLPHQGRVKRVCLTFRDKSRVQRIRFSNSRFSQRCAAPVVCFSGPGLARFPFFLSPRSRGWSAGRRQGLARPLTDPDEGSVGASCETHEPFAKGPAPPGAPPRHALSAAAPRSVIKRRDRRRPR
jgi:hypothetical protein